MSDNFEEIYRKSIEDPENFWKEASDDIFWFKKPSKILNKNKSSDAFLQKFSWSSIDFL